MKTCRHSVLAGAVVVLPGIAWAQQAGGSWSIVPSPNGGSQPAGNVLLGVAALSPADAWAVGTQPNQSQYLTGPLAIHWDGGAWSIAETPTIPALKVQLSGVAAAASGDVWAVGYSDQMNCGLCARTLIEHWNGASWSLVPSPNPGISNLLYAVAAASGTEVWGVGYQWLDYSTWRPLLLRYDGALWSALDQSQYRDGQLYSVAALAPGDAWAVGVIGVSSTGIEALALHWNGQSWTRVAFPSEPGGYIVLRGVSGSGPNDVWAVGDYKYVNLNGQTESLARTFHWDGSSWTSVLPGISGRDSRMYGVHAIASNDAWAVGGGLPAPGSIAAFVYQTVHWDGVSWSDVENPNQGVLYAVAASSGSDAWAVGFGFDGLGQSTGTLTLRYTACFANCDGSRTPPILNVSDFVCFSQRFAAGDSYANCDGSTLPPILNVSDFICFQTLFAAGCS